MTLGGSFRVGSLFMEGSGQYSKVTNQAADLRLIPKWSGNVGIYFWDKLFTDHLDLKTGLRIKGFSSSQAMNYNARYQIYVTSNDPDTPGAGVLDFLLIAHIGNAYIHFIMENLLDKQYVTTSFYPMNERNLRFWISWDFLD